MLDRLVEDLASQLRDQQDGMAALQGELMANGGDGRVVESLKRKLRRAEEGHASQLEKVQRSLEKHKKEIIVLNAELSRSKREEERMRRHVRQLEAELKTAQRRNAAMSGGSSAARGRTSRTRVRGRVPGRQPQRE